MLNNHMFVINLLNELITSKNLGSKIAFYVGDTLAPNGALRIKNSYAYIIVF